MGSAALFIYFFFLLSYLLFKKWELKEWGVDRGRRKGWFPELLPALPAGSLFVAASPGDEIPEPNETLFNGFPILPPILLLLESLYSSTTFGYKL